MENAEKLVRDLAEQFDAADARLRADALKLKATWDDLRAQPTTRSCAAGVAGRHGARGGGRRGAFLVHLKHGASCRSRRSAFRSWFPSPRNTREFPRRRASPGVLFRRLRWHMLRLLRRRGGCRDGVTVPEILVVLHMPAS